MSDGGYTGNIKEKIRIDIGKLLLIHEFKKLFRRIEVKLPSSFEEISIDIGQMAKKVQDGDEVGIRDFWNLVDSIMMGYKLKNIVHQITSACFNWSLEDSAIDNLKFTSNDIKINGFGIDRKSASEVSQSLLPNPQELKRVREKTSKEFPKGDTRYKDPIIVLNENKDLLVLDGNGRLIRAMILNIKTLKAYIGVRNTNTECNCWVPTNYLDRLNQEGNPCAKDLLTSIKAHSQNAQYEFDNRVVILKK